MPLTPTDVANKQFRIAFRGYSLDEVDAFLDEVENELTRLLRAGSEPSGRTPAPPAAALPGAEPEAPTAVEAPAPAPLTGLQGQEAALRTLLLAQRTADEAIAEARAEADELLTAARAEAERTVREATAEADRTLSTSQDKAARIDEDVAARIQAATGDLDVRRRQLESRIDELRAFEREYRTRLKAYLETQLRELDSGARPTEEAGSGVPADARAAAVGGGPAPRPAVGPFAPRTPVGLPVAVPAGPGPSGTAETGQDDGEPPAPDGPPREADAGAVRPVPLAVPGSPVGPFTSVGSGEGEAAPADSPSDR